MTDPAKYVPVMRDRLVQKFEREFFATCLEQALREADEVPECVIRWLDARYEQSIAERIL